MAGFIWRHVGKYPSLRMACAIQFRLPAPTAIENFIAGTSEKDSTCRRVRHGTSRHGLNHSTEKCRGKAAQLSNRKCTQAVASTRSRRWRRWRRRRGWKKVSADVLGSTIALVMRAQQSEHAYNRTKGAAGKHRIWILLTISCSPLSFCARLHDRQPRLGTKSKNRSPSSGAVPVMRTNISSAIILAFWILV